MDFDLKGARAAGYTDVQIADAMAAKANFDITGARAAKYSDQQIIELLSKPRPLADQIPVTDEDRAFGASQPAPAPKNADPGLVDQLVGTGETALTLATGATAGAVGMLGGTAKGLAQSVMDGTYATHAGVRQVEQAAAEGMSALTYQPRTDAGQQQTAAVGELAAAAIPATGLTAELGAMARGAGASAGAARDLTAGSVQRIRTAAPAIADRVQRTLTRNPEPATPTPGTRGSAGAAGTDMATQRRQVADQVGVKLTRGQATRDQQQLRFEQEQAKGEFGQPLRDRYSEQNEQLSKHFDHLVDMTGAEAADLIGAGRTVDKALREKAARDKAEIRVAYKNAEKAGEMEAPVQLDDLVAHLNESAPDAATAPVLNVARQRVLQLGLATEGPDGQLVAAPVTLKTAETMRQAIGRATNFEPTNIRQSTIIKGLIDTGTEGAGGQAYKAARRLRENFAKQYEDRAVVASLLNNKKGMADRKVALEDVFEHVVLKGDRADIGHVRRVLQTGGDEGKQAWREIQGATMDWIRKEAFSNTATDHRDKVILSVAKLDKAIKRLEDGNKLDFVFGKQGAQHLRDLNDLAKHVYTAPPGTVNSSNTASVLLGALVGIESTGTLTGIPLPIVSGLRLLSKQVKNRQIQKRIEQALQGRATSATPPPPARPPGATLH
jgi:hypothetical protein